MSLILFDPSSGSPRRQLEFADADQVERALCALNSGFLSWRKLSPRARAKILIKGIQALEAMRESMCFEMSSSMGKPIAQSRAEFNKSIHAARYLCELDFSFLEPERVEALDLQASSYKIPLGIIYSVMPWNFPLWQVIRMVIPALLAGNTIFLKHAELTVGVGELLARAFSKDVLGYDVLRHIMVPYDFSERILSDSRVGGVSLTGSVRAGKVLAELAGRHLKKGVFELGGSDPSLVFEDCDLEQTASSILRSRFLNAGQVCIATKRVFVQRSVLNSVLDALKIGMQKFKPSPALEENAELGPLASKKFSDQFQDQVKNILQFGQIIEQVPVSSQLLNLNQNSQAAYVAPVLILFDSQPEFFKTNEIFGPALCVFPFDTEEEVIRLANSTVFGLGASLYTNDQQRLKRITHEMRAGHVAWNQFVSTDVRLPFGGFRDSGFGRELGRDGFLEFVTTKVVVGSSHALE